METIRLTNSEFEAANVPKARQAVLTGATMISITHDIASARKIGNRIGVIFDCKMIWSGAVDKIDQSVDAHVGQFIASRAERPRQMQARRL
ncbi:MAG: hypothetical protein O3B21_00885 [Proteobacteria bacterium]|nr:hypothetical protein [Pseudomonadota bacterium]MDA1355165.1 hypothetical protein [Pseudomonadota bacterium]